MAKVNKTQAAADPTAQAAQSDAQPEIDTAAPPAAEGSAAAATNTRDVDQAADEEPQPAVDPVAAAVDTMSSTAEQVAADNAELAAAATAAVDASAAPADDVAVDQGATRAGMTFAAAADQAAAALAPAEAPTEPVAHYVGSIACLSLLEQASIEIATGVVAQLASVHGEAFINVLAGQSSLDGNAKLEAIALAARNVAQRVLAKCEEVEADTE